MPDGALFTEVANAIRERFGISGLITPLQFGNKINPNTPVLSIGTNYSFDAVMDMIWDNTADAIKERGGASGLIEPNDMPTVIRNLTIISYGGLTSISQSNVTWTSKPSVPSVSISQKSYTLTWEYTWSHSSYDKYKINSVTITPNNSSVYNPAYGSNIKSRPYGNDVVDSLYIRCSYSRTVDLSGLISNMQSLGAPTDEILSEMRSELSSAISSVNQLAGTFSFSIGYYGGTYV